MFCEPRSREKRITSNKTIIECARDYVNDTQKKEEVLKLLKHTRLCKQVFLPYELVRKSRKEHTEASKNKNKQIKIK